MPRVNCWFFHKDTFFLTQSIHLRCFVGLNLKDHWIRFVCTYVFNDEIGISRYYLVIGFLHWEVSISNKLKIFFLAISWQISDDFFKFTSNFQLLNIPKNSILSTIRYYNRYIYDNILYNNRLFAHHCPCCCCKILFFKCQKRNAFCEE